MNTAIKYGNWAALVNILLILLCHYTITSTVGFVGLTFFTALVVELTFAFLSIWFTRKLLNGEIDFKAAARAGLTTILVSSILTCLYIYIHYRYVNPELISKFIIEYEKLLVIRKISPELIKEEIHTLEQSMTPITVAWQSFFKSILLETFVIIIMARLLRTVKRTGI